MNEIIEYGNQEIDFKDYPSIFSYIDDDNPYLSSPNAPYDLPFYQTRDSLLDVEVYKAFLNNAVSRFRRSRYYKTYKSYLMGLGLDKCAIMGNVTDDMAKLEMHHNFLTIHDIALMITEHVINTVGKISTFDLINLLIAEHWNNNVPIVMLTETMHQIYHSDQNYFISPNSTFGKWWELLYKYRFGITINIARKVINYIDRYSNTAEGNMFVNMRNNILSFSNYNQYGYNNLTINQLDNMNQNLLETELF